MPKSKSIECEMAGEDCILLVDRIRDHRLKQEWMEVQIVNADTMRLRKKVKLSPWNVAATDIEETLPGLSERIQENLVDVLENCPVTMEQG